MKREKLEPLATTLMIERKRSGEKHLEKMFDELANWLKVRQKTGALKSTRDRDDHDRLISLWVGYLIDLEYLFSEKRHYSIIVAQTPKTVFHLISNKDEKKNGNL